MCNPHKKQSAPTIEHQRIERENMFRDFNLKHDALLYALNNFRGKGERLITKKTLSKFPLMEWIELNDKVRFRQRQPLGETLVFDTIIKPQGEFGLHLHDCDEYCDVIEGVLTDLMTNRDWKAGEMARMNKGEDHLPIATTYTVLKVYFI